MKIALAAPAFLGAPSESADAGRALLRALSIASPAREFVLLGGGTGESGEVAARLADLLALPRVRLRSVRVSPVAELLTGGLRGWLAERALLRAEAPDLFWSVTPFGRYGESFRTILTVREVAWKEVPETYEPETREMLERRVPQEMLRAHGVVVHSETAREEVLRHLPIARRRVAVVPEGVREGLARVEDPGAIAAVRERLGIPERYFLARGTLDPRRNFECLLRAFDRVVHEKALAGVELVIAGPRGPRPEVFFRELDRLGVQDRVRVTGPVAEEDLAPLLSGALAFLHPPLHDGAAGPALEALACGAPLVCSRAGALPEIVGEAALFLDPRDDRGWAEAMVRIAEDAELREVLRRRGMPRARRFRWEEGAAALAEFFEKVVREEPPGPRMP